MAGEANVCAGKEESTLLSSVAVISPAVARAGLESLDAWSGGILALTWWVAQPATNTDSSKANSEHVEFAQAKKRGASLTLLVRFKSITAVQLDRRLFSNVCQSYFRRSRG